MKSEFSLKWPILGLITVKYNIFMIPNDIFKNMPTDVWTIPQNVYTAYYLILPLQKGKYRSVLTVPKAKFFSLIQNLRRGGGIFELHDGFSLTFPLRKYFFRIQEHFSGLLAVHEFFSVTFLLHESSCSPPHTFLIARP